VPGRRGDLSAHYEEHTVVVALKRLCVQVIVIREDDE
jgi:hypothetical protein